MIALALLMGLWNLPAAVAGDSPFAPGESSVVVELYEGASADAVADAVDVDPTATFDHAIDGFAGSFTTSEIARLRRNPHVRRIVANHRVGVVPAADPSPAPDPLSLTTVLDTVSTTVEALLVDLGVLPPQATPTAVQRVGAERSPTARIDGTDQRVGATIAVIDTGITRHRDLNLVGGKDCVDDADPFVDEFGHGTGVAGTAAAVDNQLDVVGVAPGARLLSARAVDSHGGAYLDSLLCALEWAIDPAQRTDVINISLAWYQGSFSASHAPCGSGAGDMIHEAICTAVERGITVVAAAGNDGGLVTPWFPAAYPEVIAVSGLADFDGLPGSLAEPLGCGPTDTDDHLRKKSNYGPEIDIAAVALCVTTTAPGGGTTVAGGTSFAAPAVAGAAALLYGGSPTRPTPAQVRARLLATVEPGAIPGDPDGGGEGVLDVSTL